MRCNSFHYCSIGYTPGPHPHGAGLRFPDLLPFRGREEGERDAMHGAASYPSDVLNPGDDIAPLVQAAELDGDGALVAQMHEVVCLKELVRELGEADAVVGGEAAPSPSPLS